jgi:hypothetical protein
MPPFHVLVPHNRPRRPPGIVASHSDFQLPISAILTTRFRLLSRWLTLSYLLVVRYPSVIEGETARSCATSGPLFRRRGRRSTSAGGRRNPLKPAQNIVRNLSPQRHPGRIGNPQSGG